MDKRDNRNIILILLILCQAFIGILFGLNYVLVSNNIIEPLGGSGYVYVILVAVLGFGSIYTVKELLHLTEIKYEAKIKKVELENSQHLIEVLREHRHDYVNHLQVIYGLVQLEKVDEVGPYIQRLTNEMETKSKLTSIKHLPLAAFLARKELFALSRSIRFEMDIDIELDNIPLSTTELTSIIGNLVDNAIYAAQETKSKEPIVRVEIKKDNGYKIRIFNNGQPIPEDIKTKIFETGFTTKGEKGSGLGLGIVKNIVERYNGQLHLESHEHGTSFSIYFQ